MSLQELNSVFGIKTYFNFDRTCTFEDVMTHDKINAGRSSILHCSPVSFAFLVLKVLFQLKIIPGTRATEGYLFFNEFLVPTYFQ